MLGLPRLRHLSARLRRLPSGQGQDTVQVLSSMSEDRKKIELGKTAEQQGAVGREASQEVMGAARRS